MDILDILRRSIAALPDGEHSRGLGAVLSHIESAYRHLARGQVERDDDAYIDAIYRSNQAFEGSIKEAYRVLAKKNPAKMPVYEIEKYLEREGIFESRILSLFKNYRTEWRNPSTHDYSLDFSESEAFLAIISVTAFAKLLSDQISKLLMYREEVASKASSILFPEGFQGWSALDKVTFIVHRILNSAEYGEQLDQYSEYQIAGFMSGNIARYMSDCKTLESPKESKSLGDVVVVENDEEVVLIVKRLPNNKSISALLGPGKYDAIEAAAANVVVVNYTGIGKYEMYPFGGPETIHVITKDWADTDFQSVDLG